MSENTLTPRPADWLTVDDGELYEGPEHLEPGAEWGVKLMWTPDGIRFGLSSDTSIEILTRAELQALRLSIDHALEAEDKLG